MMNFSLPYQLAMREQAPAMFNRLRRTGALSAHLKAKSAEAHRLFDDLAKDKPKLPNGQVRSASDLREIEEQVFATFLDFPADETNPASGPQETNLEETPTRVTTSP